MKHLKLSITILLTTVISLTACSTSHQSSPTPAPTEVVTEAPTPTPYDPYPFIDYGLSLKELQKEMGKKPDKKKKNGSMVDYTYNDTEYYGCTGKSIYHFSSDGSTLMYSEFQTSASSKEEGQNIYAKISEGLTDTHGEGIVADSKNNGMTTWEYGSETTTVSYDFTEKKKCVVTVTNIKSTDINTQKKTAN